MNRIAAPDETLYITVLRCSACRSYELAGSAAGIADLRAAPSIGFGECQDGLLIHLLQEMQEVQLVQHNICTIHIIIKRENWLTLQKESLKMYMLDHHFPLMKLNNSLILITSNMMNWMILLQ